jgi:hypothetical protein
MAITNGTVLRVVASLLFPDDVIAQNVFHMVATDLVDGDEDTVTLDMQRYLNSIYAELDDAMSQDMSGDEIKVYEYDSSGEDFDEVGTGALTLSGASANDPVPHGVALVQNLYTTDPDVQGRKFWAGIAISTLTDQEFDASVLADAVAGAAILIVTYTDGTSSNEYQPGVWSPTHANFYPYNGVVATNSVPGYQRRRKPGVGI